MGIAASLRDVALALVEELEAREPARRIFVSFGASNALARQVELGAPIDVLVSADEQIVRSLADKGIVEPESIVEIARGRLVLAMPSGSPLEKLGLDALRSTNLERLGLPSAAVPLGRYGRAWLEGQGLFEGLEGKILPTENARANLAALARGHVDLAIVYATDMRPYPSLQAIHRPAPETYPPIRYVVARVSRAPACREIDEVLKAWQSSTMKTQLAAAGFEVAATTLRPPDSLDHE
jgi:molybdate transport system substrate-binding protein